MFLSALPPFDRTRETKPILTQDNLVSMQDQDIMLIDYARPHTHGRQELQGENMVQTQLGEAALSRLHIQYHMHPFPDEVLFFCKLQNGISFDLSFSSNGAIRLWRYVLSDMPRDKAGMRFSHSRTGNPDFVVGFEVTDEGDLCFFSEQSIAASEDEAENLITKQLTEFSILLCELTDKFGQHAFPE